MTLLEENMMTNPNHFPDFATMSAVSPLYIPVTDTMLEKGREIYALTASCELDEMLAAVYRAMHSKNRSHVP